jgi:diadenosine tetraphosphate (Ap4A) HIT family hydrolase
MRYCYLCGDLQQDPETSGIARLYGEDALGESFLWEDDEFFLIPAPGTITPGYLILATKLHCSRFADLGTPTLAKAERIWTRIQKLGQQLGLAPYVLFEHGGVSYHQRGAACIDHAHFHMAPCLHPLGLWQNLHLQFDETLLGGFREIRDLSNKPPYILLVTSNEMYSYITPAVQSQFVRRLLALQWGVPMQWNWRLHTFPENFRATFQMFKDYFPRCL